MNALDSFRSDVQTWLEKAAPRSLRGRATDPAAEQDFPAYCKQTGHELVSSRREGDVLIFVIRKR